MVKATFEHGGSWSLKYCLLSQHSGGSWYGFVKHRLQDPVSPNVPIAQSWGLFSSARREDQALFPTPHALELHLCGGQRSPPRHPALMGCCTKNKYAMIGVNEVPGQIILGPGIGLAGLLCWWIVFVPA